MRKELNIGNLPGRRRKCLSVTTFHTGGGASVKPIAYFVSEEAFKEFRDLARKGIAPLIEEESPSAKKKGPGQ